MVASPTASSTGKEKHHDIFLAIRMVPLSLSKRYSQAGKDKISDVGGSGRADELGTYKKCKTKCRCGCWVHKNDKAVKKGEDGGFRNTG